MGVNRPDWAHAETFVPEGPDLIQSLAKSKHYLIIVYNTGVARRLAKYDLATGQITEIKPPFSGNRIVECPDWRLASHNQNFASLISLMAMAFRISCRASLAASSERGSTRKAASPARFCGKMSSAREGLIRGVSACQLPDDLVCCTRELSRYRRFAGQPLL